MTSTKRQRFEKEKYRIKTNRDFWWKKIEGNIRRDQTVNQFLVDKGWKVIRFWSKEIHKNLNFCVEEIITTLDQQKSGN